MSSERLDGIARRLADARRASKRITLEDPPRDFEEAFAVQDRLVALLGEPVIGWKVIEMPDRRVIFAPLLASGVVPAGGTWRVGGGEPAGIELEIAFRMGRDVPGDAGRDEVCRSIASAHVVFELCESRNAAPDTVPRHVSLADCISNSGIVVGAAFTGWEGRDMRAVPGRLHVDGALHVEGKSVDPIRAMEVLPGALAARGKALRAGHIVITGSLIGMNWLTGRHTLKGEIDGCGTVEAALVAT